MKLRDLFKPKTSTHPTTSDSEPDPSDALKTRAGIALQNGNPEKALLLYDELIAQKSNDAEAYYKRGNTLGQLRRWDLALANYDEAIALQPDYANAFCNRGTMLERLGRWDDALASYERAIHLNPSDFLALFNRATVLKELKRFEEALATYELAISLNNKYTDAHINRANVLQELGRHEEAIASYDQALRLNPSDFFAFFNRGTVLKKLQRFDEALAAYEQAISLKSDYLEAHINRGNILQELELHEEAVRSYDRAIDCSPLHSDAFADRGASLLKLRDFEAAIASYDKALALNANQRFTLGMRAYAKLQICDWDDLESDLIRLTGALSEGRAVCTPFPALSLIHSAALQCRAAQIFVREECPPNDALPAIRMRIGCKKIRIGYFSSDFRNHPVSLLSAELFETHDRSQFEVVGFAFGPKTNDPMRSRLERAFDRFIDVRKHSDVDVALVAREFEIHIAVDLGGFTEHSRTKIFAHRAAPIQLSYLGYLGTMGASYMDYLVADATIVPITEQEHYTEKIVYLPCYQVNDSQRRIPDKMFSREQLGIPPSVFVFSCFNSNYKIMPAVFSVWMRILSRAKNSVLFLYADNNLAARNLTKEATLCGIDSRRIIFGGRIPISDYLTRFRTMDLFLDTLPYNAGTTASDALWAGLPVLTCLGKTFSGRVAASLLKAIDLPELVTSTLGEYEDLAVDLATNPHRLAQIKQKLAHNRLTTPLFNTADFTRNLEFAYDKIYQRYLSGQAPEHVYPACSSSTSGGI